MQNNSSQTDWEPYPDNLDFQPHQVDVWRINLDLSPATVKSLESTLLADDAKRADRFRYPIDRKRYIVAHGCLRSILARYLQCKPEELRFNTNKHGKPTAESYKLEFNLSHSGDYVLIAVAQEHKVGIDVERIRSDMEFESIAHRFFSPNETAELTSMPPEQKTIAFFNCWTRKEAYIKAQGLGLSLPLGSFDVSLTPNEPAILRATRPDAEKASHWTLFSLIVAPHYAGALAVEGQGINLRLLDWNPAIR